MEKVTTERDKEIKRIHQLTNDVFDMACCKSGDWAFREAIRKRLNLIRANSGITTEIKYK